MYMKASQETSASIRVPIKCIFNKSTDLLSFLIKYDMYITMEKESNSINNTNRDKSDVQA